MHTKKGQMVVCRNSVVVLVVAYFITLIYIYCRASANFTTLSCHAQGPRIILNTMYSMYSAPMLPSNSESFHNIC